MASDDGVQVVPRPGPRATEVQETAAGRSWKVAADGFWQVHPGAADALVEQVLAAAGGAERVWDLFSGVGLFAGALAAAQSTRRISAVEGNRRAVELARENLAGLPGVRVYRSDVSKWVGERNSARPDLVVADPPRKGLGRQLVHRLSATGASRVILIACDPASLGRDTGLLREQGWTLVAATALDMFPMTHHVETVAVFER